MGKQRADGRFVKTWTNPATGKRESFYHEDEEEAERMREDAKKGRTSAPILSDDPLLIDVAEKVWWPDVEATTRPNTLRRYRDCWQRHIKTKFGRRELGSITPQEVQSWINAKKSEGFSPSSLAMMRGVLSMVYNAARRADLCDRNPASLIKLPKKRKRKKTITLGDARRVLASVEGTPLAAPIFLAMVLGMRRGEAIGLRWANVDEKTGRVQIVEQRTIVRPLVGKGTAQQTDTKRESSERSFILPPSLLSALVKVGDGESPWVCTRKGKPWPPEVLTREWVGVRASVGLADWTLHDLRHGAAGVLAALGVDLLTIAAILGHSSVDMTMLYAAAQEATATAGLSRLGEALFPTEKVDTRLEK